jgi:predicted RNase H-like HicB family nuclease
VLLTPDIEDSGYTVTVPALPGCITEGDTVDEALANAREAIACHLQGLAIDGEPILEEQEAPRLVAIEV